MKTIKRLPNSRIVAVMLVNNTTQFIVSEDAIGHVYSVIKDNKKYLEYFSPDVLARDSGIKVNKKIKHFVKNSVKFSPV